MNVWMKLNTLVRGQARESAERVIDRHSLCIFEQEIVDCEQALHAAKHHLSTVMAEKVRLQRDRHNQEERRRQREQQALSALATGNEALALEVADAIAELEGSLEQTEQQIARLEKQETALKKRLTESARTLADYRRELNLLKATEKAQQASGLLSGHANTIHDRVANMQGSLERIRARQQSWDDRDAALESLARETGESDLDEKLRQAGIQTAPVDAQRVLERLRQRPSP